MSTDKFGSQPLPGLPKALFYLQLVQALMDEIKKICDLVHAHTGEEARKQDQ